jgi:hypothetical protein
MEVLEPPADPDNPEVVWSTDRISEGVGQALSPVAFRAALGVPGTGEKSRRTLAAFIPGSR